jgi:HK97 family phage prohead protease
MTPSTNWNNFKYEWFRPLEWRQVKHCQESFSEAQKNFWSFMFWLKKKRGEYIPKKIPEFVDTEKTYSEDDVKSIMLNWRTLILEYYEQYKTKKLHGEPTDEIETELIKNGWSANNEPIELIDITIPIYENYYNPMDLNKKERTPFKTEPMILKKEHGKIQKFYFVAPAQISKAFVEVDGVEYTSDAAVKKAKAEGVKKYFIAGGISGTDTDMDEERMSPECIKAMEESGRSGNIPLRNAHNKEWDADIGKMVDIKMASDKKSTLWAKFQLNDFEEDPTAKKLWFAIKNGKKIGYSIGGIVNKFHYEMNPELRKEQKVYDDIALKEVSVTGYPSYTGSFLYSITKSMNQLEKKPLQGGARRKLKDSDFAYVNGKERKLPIFDAAHVRNALARFSQTELPSSAKAAVWRKILTAARKFNIKVNDKKKTQKSTDGISLEKFQGVLTYLDIQKDYTSGIYELLAQMRADLKNHMDNDNEEEAELNETLEDMASDINEIKEEESEEEDEEEVGENVEDVEEYGELSSDDFRTLLKIFVLLSDLEYPKDAVMPDNYIDISMQLPIEAYILVDGQQMLPHHNMDYTVNREWLMYQLKQVMDGNVYVDMDDYLEILSHLHYHVMENVKKNTDEQVNTTEAGALTPEQKEVVEEVAPETLVTEAAPKEDAPTEAPKEESKEEKQVVAEAPTEEHKPEEQSAETPKEEIKEDISEEAKAEPAVDEEKSKLIEELALLKKHNEELEARLSAVENTPVYKQATETVSGEDTKTGEELSAATHLRFEKSSYTLEEALDAVKSLAPFDSYKHKQLIRTLYPQS